MAGDVDFVGWVHGLLGVDGAISVATEPNGT
jgi:hypothetical protein